MKRFLLLFVTIALMGCGGAPKELTFLGIKVAQPTGDFNDHLEALGFEESEGFLSSSGEYMVDVAGVKCVAKHKIFLSDYTLDIHTWEAGNWAVNEQNYLTLRKALTKELGKPTEIIEDWGETPPADNAERMRKLHAGDATYMTVWNHFEDEEQTIGWGVALYIDGRKVVMEYITPQV